MIVEVISIILMLKIVFIRVLVLNTSIQYAHSVLEDHINKIKELINVIHVLKIIPQSVKVPLQQKIVKVCN